MANDDKLAEQLKKQLAFYSRAPTEIIGLEGNKDFATYAKEIGQVYA